VSIPPFNEHGDLPARVFTVTIHEALAHFGSSSPERRLIGTRLERIYEIARKTQHLRRFIVFGSFVTAKVAPNDIDIFIIMDDDFDVTQVVPPASILFDHPSAQPHFGASVFWLRGLAALGGEEAAVEDWMITREGRKRGLLEISD
jgi:hypothetical protein